MTDIAERASTSPPDRDDMDDRVAALERAASFARKAVIAIAAAALTGLGGSLAALYHAGSESGAQEVRLRALESEVEHQRNQVEWLLSRVMLRGTSPGDAP